MNQKCKLSKKGSPGEIWTAFRSSSSQMFFNMVFLKFRKFHRITPVLETLLNKRDFNTKLQHLKAPVAATDVSLIFSKESGTKTSPIVSDKYQIQLIKCICCRRNQHLSKGDSSWIYLPFYFSILSFLNFAMTNGFVVLCPDIFIIKKVILQYSSNLVFEDARCCHFSIVDIIAESVSLIQMSK